MGCFTFSFGPYLHKSCVTPQHIAFPTSHMAHAPLAGGRWLLLRAAGPGPGGCAGSFPARGLGEVFPTKSEDSSAC